MANVKIKNPELVTFSDDIIAGIKNSTYVGLLSLRSIKLESASDTLVHISCEWTRITNTFQLAQDFRVYWYACELAKLEAEYGKSANIVQKEPTEENKKAHEILGKRLDSVKPVLQAIAKQPYSKWVEPFVNGLRMTNMNAYPETLRTEFEHIKTKLIDEFKNGDVTKWGKLAGCFEGFTRALWYENLPSYAEEYVFNPNGGFAKSIFSIYGKGYNAGKDGIMKFVRSDDSKIIAQTILQCIALLQERQKKESKPDSKPESKPESKPDSKPDSKKDSKQESNDK